ncbi:MAG: DNA-3-methyladenine glycosylase [Aquamicrobium sp.]|uniref:DNA-3-methyladenine glycosylase family protein n=1 Tax=Aquamicrobium sp. TaxID=1872579 RepID=UPI00349E595D|nr:DNA-3-methyladenine glycosylase [Aquamicrobium sp.]
MRRIATLDDIAEGLDVLKRLDPRLAAVADIAGPVPLRLAEPSFASLAGIVIAQQVSRASADAMSARLAALVDPLDAAGVLAGGEEALRAAGLSRAKQAALLAVARAEVEDRLDLSRLAGEGADEAMASLTALRGIGPWTAEVYLLFCAGHPDIFPARDVALQSAVGHALSISPRPAERVLYGLAESWAPWRGVAARLFWAYYRRMHGRDAAPLPD